MRSWGVCSIGDDRWTNQWPTASAVLGLTGACMGVDRHSPEQVTAWYSGFMVCTLSAVAYRHKRRRYHESYPSLLSDLQTIRNSLNANGRLRKDTIVSHRGYITDGIDIAAIIPVHNEAEEWLEQLVYAIQQPRFTPYLGRRSNPLSAPMVEPGEGVTAVQSTVDLCDHLFWRLSALQVGELCPSECLLRLPYQLRDESVTFKEAWFFTGKDMVSDQRVGFLRFFTNRTVLCYRRRIEGPKKNEE